MSETRFQETTQEESGLIQVDAANIELDDKALVAQLRSKATVDQWAALERLRIKVLEDAKNEAYKEGKSDGYTAGYSQCESEHYLIGVPIETIDYIDSLVMERIANPDYPEKSIDDCHRRMLASLITH